MPVLGGTQAVDTGMGYVGDCMYIYRGKPPKLVSKEYQASTIPWKRGSGAIAGAVVGVVVKS